MRSGNAPLSRCLCFSLSSPILFFLSIHWRFAADAAMLSSLSLSLSRPVSRTAELVASTQSRPHSNRKLHASFSDPLSLSPSLFGPSLLLRILVADGEPIQQCTCPGMRRRGKGWLCTYIECVQGAQRSRQNRAPLEPAVVVYMFACMHTDVDITS